METRDLKKLKRVELYEIMLAQSEEIDRLRAELEQKDQELAQRQIDIAEAGSIAEASLALTHVFDEAQKAADLYLQNVQDHAVELLTARLQQRTHDRALDTSKGAPGSASPARATSTAPHTPGAAGAHSAPSHAHVRDALEAATAATASMPATPAPAAPKAAPAAEHATPAAAPTIPADSPKHSALTGLSGITGRLRKIGGR